MKTSEEILEDAIISLQTKRKQDLSLLKLELNNTKETFKLSNILKDTRVELVGFLKEEGNDFNEILRISTKEITSKISKFANKIRL